MRERWDLCIIVAYLDLLVNMLTTADGDIALINGVYVAFGWYCYGYG